MSRVNSSSSRAAPEVAAAAPAALAAPAAIPTEPLAAPMSTSETSLFDSAEASSRASLSEVHTRNVVVDARLTATELNLGKSMPLSRNLAQVFADGVDGVTRANTKVVITGIELQNVFSDVPKRVSVSANLFQNKTQQTGLKNEAGWLYSQQSSELASEAAEHVAYGGDGSFVNLCSLLPFEQARHTNCAVYTPTNSSLNQRHLQDYGNISTKEQLWDGIVEVTPTTYYVPAESVVCKVISKNWDRFGFSPQNEEKVEGSFYRIDKPIVQSVVNQLYDNVIARLPFTSLDNLKLHLQSNVEPSNSVSHNCSMQLKINYRYPQNN